MAEQATAGDVDSTGTTGELAHDDPHLEHNSGRPISWVGTSVIIVGFIVGGIAFVPTPHWVIVWIATAIAVVGILILAFSKAMSTDWY